MDTVTVYSPAKINLGLEIVGKRADGYHEIQTIFQKVSLYDELTFKILSSSEITVTVDNPAIPSGNANLAYKAAELLLKEQLISTGVSIHIKKRIPAAAGLGGGSSNAAATLLGINSLLQLELSSSYLQQLSIPLGADVPFFLSGYGTAYGSGIGEKLKPVQLHTTLWCILIFPGISISTAWAYTTYSKYNILTKEKKNIKFVNSIEDIDALRYFLFNDFESVVYPVYPEIKAIKDSLVQAGAVGSLLSGSGSSVFGIFSTKHDCDKALALLPVETSRNACIVHSL